MSLLELDKIQGLAPIVGGSIEFPPNFCQQKTPRNVRVICRGKSFLSPK
jgi:hypothetical protein